jgi:hypothetical protein
LTGIDIVGIIEIIYSSNLVWVYTILSTNAKECFAIMNPVVSYTIVPTTIILARVMPITIGWNKENLAGIDMVWVIESISIGNSVGAYAIITANAVKGFSIPNFVVRTAIGGCNGGNS